MSGRIAIVLAVCLVLTGCSGSEFTGPEVVDPDPIVAEYEAAYDAADFGRVQDVFAEDGVFFTAGDVHELGAGDDTALDALGPDGWEFSRRYQVHAGDDLSVIDPVQVGAHAVAFGWTWQELAAGTGTMALRDGAVAAVVLSVEGIMGGATAADVVDPILAEFEAASESSDADRLRELFAEDATVATVADAHELYHGNEALVGSFGLDGETFGWWIEDHRREDLVIVEPVQIGDDIAFGWGWEGGDSGTAVMDVEDGRIVVLVLTAAGEPVTGSGG